MRKIGIVGGAAWPSTLEYYRLICAGANAHFEARGTAAPLPTPPMAIESLVVAETRALRGRAGDEASWAAFDAVIRSALDRLQAAGCDFAIIANNTFHTRLHALREGLEMEILSILDAAAEAAKATGARRALVLGTSVTMRSQAYAKALAPHGIEANPPLPDAVVDQMQRLIDEEYHGEAASPAGRDALLKACRDLTDAPDGAVILLACTELPLAFPEFAGDPVFACEGFTFVNTTAAHARAALDKALSDES
ncbi:MAG: aspartate/glutamate racemase family protein [Pseudomonadota bacterium]